MRTTLPVNWTSTQTAAAAAGTGTFTLPGSGGGSILRNGATGGVT